MTRPAPMVAAAPAAAAAALQPFAAAAAVDLASPTQPRERTALQLTASGMTAPEPVLAVDSIDVAPLTVDALTHDPMPIERLETIAPMTVAPLDITDLQKERDQ